MKRFEAISWERLYRQGIEAPDSSYCKAYHFSKLTVSGSSIVPIQRLVATRFTWGLILLDQSVSEAHDDPS